MSTMTKNKYLVESELEALQRTLSRASIKNTRDGLLIETLLRTGGRVNEILRLTKANFYYDSECPVIIVPGSKGSDAREIPVTTEFFDRLWNFVKDSSGPIFGIQYKRVQQIWYDMRPAGCLKGLHALRHTYAVRQWKKNKNLQGVRQLLGHKSIMNTMIYATVPLDIEEMKKAAL